MLSTISIALLCLTVALWIRWRAKKFSFFQKLGVPGPPPNLLFGNAFEMFRKDPLQCHTEWTQKYGSVLGYYYGSHPTLLVSDPEYLKKILVKDFGTFTDRPLDILVQEGDRPDQLASQHMINNRGKTWKEIRSLITPSFTTGKLKQMMPLFHQSVGLTQSKLDAASGNGSKDVEIYALYKGLTMDSIARTAFGIETPVQDNPNHPLLRTARLLLAAKFHSIFYIIMISFREFNFILQPIMNAMISFMNKGTNPVDELFDLVASVVQARKDNPKSRRPDLLQSLIDARADEGGDISEQSLTASAEGDVTEQETVTKHPGSTKLRQLSDNDVKANAFLFFLAGYETTSTALAFLTHHMVNNIDVQDKVREEIFEAVGNDDTPNYDSLHKLPYTDRVIMESLRLHPPVHFFVNRTSNREFQLGQWTLPANLTVQVPINTIHHDPENFPNPETFNPDRFLPENRSKNHSVTWLPFGGGPRNCVGMRFALLEIKTALAQFLRKYKLVPSEKTEMKSLKLGMHLAIINPKNGIHLRAVPL